MINNAETNMITVKNEVFAGIQITYHNIHQKSYDIEMNGSENSFSIIHCREGRMECRASNYFCYISAGDLLIVRGNQFDNEVCFPLGHYHGITIQIDADKAPKCLSCFLQDVNVMPSAIIDRFCTEKPYFISRSNQSFEHIYSELYTVPKEIRQGYFKIKILELMLFLSVFEKADESQTRLISPAQVRLAKDVSQILTDSMDERITIEQVSKIVGTSATNIKTAMKAVYGVPFYSFTKAQKMESAAYMLEYTDKPIIEIAGKHGYDNASKFAAAFRSVKGISPNKYRQINTTG